MSKWAFTNNKYHTPPNKMAFTVFMCTQMSGTLLI